MEPPFGCNNSRKVKQDPDESDDDQETDDASPETETMPPPKAPNSQKKSGAQGVVLLIRERCKDIER